MADVTNLAVVPIPQGRLPLPDFQDAYGRKAHEWAQQYVRSLERAAQHLPITKPIYADAFKRVKEKHPEVTSKFFEVANDAA